jgi:Zn-dependent alcohol dehydrogenase
MEAGKDQSITVVGGFFGQSSLGSLAVVDVSCIVSLADIVNTRDELKMLAPLGCGFQTGAGTVLNLGKAIPSDTVTIIGIGGVGLAGVMVSGYSTYLN